MPEAPQAADADVKMPEAPQEDDPLAIEGDIAEPEHGDAQSAEAVSVGGSVVNIALAKAPLKALEKGVQTEMPGRTKATQTQKRGRDRAVQTKEQGIDRDRAKLRAEEQNIAALQKEVRSLKVRYIQNDISSGVIVTECYFIRISPIPVNFLRWQTLVDSHNIRLKL